MATSSATVSKRIRKLERFCTIDSTPLWTEFVYFFAYDPKAGIGISIHGGREIADREIWRATVFVFLPGGELLATKVFGPKGKGQRLELGPLTIACTAPGQTWTVDFRGAAQPVHRSVNVSSPHRDGVDEPLSFSLRFDGVTPCWDLHKSMKRAPSSLSMHVEQMCRVSGRMSFKSRTETFDGMGVRDHSSGVRDYGQVEGTFWLAALMSDGTAITAQLVRVNGVTTNAGYIFNPATQELELVTVADAPPVPHRDMPDSSMDHDPMLNESGANFTVTLNSRLGPVRVLAELQHGCAATYVSPSSEVLGTDTSRPDALQWSESVAKVRIGDVVGWGVRERVAPIRALTIPSGSS